MRGRDCAGLDMGLENAGEGRLTFRTWIESDPDARATLMANHPKLVDHAAVFSDIRDVRPDDLMKRASIERGQVFILVGGPPCQAFSTAGLRRATNDSNGMVVHNYFDKK